MCNLNTHIWSQEQKRKSKNVDFYKFLDIYLVYLGNKDMYGIFKGMLYSLFHFPQVAVKFRNLSHLVQKT